jgi:hypothetical protein
VPKLTLSGWSSSDDDASGSDSHSDHAPDTDGSDSLSGSGSDDESRRRYLTPNSESEKALW